MVEADSVLTFSAIEGLQTPVLLIPTSCLLPVANSAGLADMRQRPDIGFCVALLRSSSRSSWLHAQPCMRNNLSSRSTLKVGANRGHRLEDMPCGSPLRRLGTMPKPGLPVAAREPGQPLARSNGRRISQRRRRPSPETVKGCTDRPSGRASHWVESRSAPVTRSRYS